MRLGIILGTIFWALLITVTQVFGQHGYVMRATGPGIEFNITFDHDRTKDDNFQACRYYRERFLESPLFTTVLCIPEE